MALTTNKGQEVSEAAKLPDIEEKVKLFLKELHGYKLHDAKQILHHTEECLEMVSVIKSI